MPAQLPEDVVPAPPESPRRLPVSLRPLGPGSASGKALPSGRSVLIVLFGRIGDVIFTLPSVQALKRARPDISVDWLVEDRCADLLLGHPALRQVFLFRRGDYSRAVKDRRYGQALGILGGLVRSLRQERYAAVLDFQGLLKSGVATFLARGDLKLGSPSTYGRMREGAGLFSRQVPMAQEGLHLVERHLLVVRELLGEAVSPEPLRLAFTEEEHHHVRSLVGSSPYILIHPFASWTTRNWPSSSWARVVRELSGRGFRIALAGAGGATQEEMKAEIERSVSVGLVDLLGRLSLRELSLAMGLSEAVLAVDSGPMHLAASTGTRVVALFGPTDPVRLGPYGPRVGARGEEEMGPNGRVVTAGLPCQPCMMRRCPIGTPCQDRLEPGAVIAAFEEVLRGQVKAGQARELMESRR